MNTMDRRTLLRSGAAVAMASTIGGIPVVAQAAEEAKKPRPLSGKDLKMKDVLRRIQSQSGPC